MLKITISGNFDMSFPYSLFCLRCTIIVLLAFARRIPIGAASTRCQLLKTRIGQRQGWTLGKQLSAQRMGIDYQPSDHCTGHETADNRNVSQGYTVAHASLNVQHPGDQHGLWEKIMLCMLSGAWRRPYAFGQRYSV